ncbi:MAG: putative LPS assembly protein LptD [Bacteroidia bacterium]|nr:putative LPS assembly protein LptD [Bacteroidia bacterium]
MHISVGRWLLLVLLGLWCVRGLGQTPGGALPPLPGRTPAAIAGDTLAADTLTSDSTAAAPNRRQQYIDSLKATSDLKAPVVYKAADSIVFDARTGVLMLYESGDLTYDDLNLKARRVKVEIQNQYLQAYGLEDSAGRYTGAPQFVQGEQTFEAKEITYNFSTRKGRVTETRTAQGEGFIIAEVAKYQTDGSFHGKEGKFTTCDADDPHFYVEANKMKVLPDKRLISGPIKLVVADFPLPVVVPFAFLPKLDFKGKQTGLQMPQYGEAGDRGFYLRNLGYYFAINDYLDLTISGDIFTRGGWRLGATSNYRVKYRFDGQIAFNYGVVRFNEETDPDYRRESSWSLVWSHNQPIDPTARLSASVNISSSNTFQRQVSLNQSDYITNNLNSSINFQKRFNNLPFIINMSARHQQDLNRETMSLQLPEASFSMNRQTPFKSLDSRYLKWLKQLGVTYNMQGRNSVTNIPDTLLIPVLFRPQDSITTRTINGTDTTFRRQTAGSLYANGLKHNAAASTTLKLFKLVNISPQISYEEVWYSKFTQKYFDTLTNKVREEQIQGFQRGYYFNTSVSANVNFFGIYQLTRSKREIAFQQRFTNSLSYVFTPNFADPQFGFYKTVQRDTLGNTELYSIFEDGIYGGPGKGRSQSIGYSLTSAIAMKYRKKESFEPDFEENKDPFERISIIDNLGLNTSYNIAADSFQLSPFQLSARTSLFERKLNINASATVDPYRYGRPYEVDFPLRPPASRRLNELMILEEGKLGRLTSVQVSLSTSLRPPTGKRDLNKAQQVDAEEFAEVQRTYYQYVDFALPWSLNLNYTFSYRKPDDLTPKITQTVNLDGDLTFAQSWKVGFNSGIDIQNLQVTTTSLNIFRELHCWQLGLRWIPFGPQKSYSVTLSARSSILSSLRLAKNDFWQDRFTNL